MLYTIIPPALVILSLAGIIIFLMKKSSAVANLEGPALAKKEEGKAEKSKRRLLFILEKTVHFLKFIFFNLGNKLSAWSESIKQKRNLKAEKKNSYVLEKKEEKSDLEYEAEAKNFFRRRSKSDSEKIKLEAETETNDELETEIKIEEKIEIAQNSSEKKDLFEKILIERIAANPKDIEAYERLGEYYMEIKNWNYAKECFKQVLRLSPGNANVRSKMRKLERLLGK